MASGPPRRAPHRVAAERGFTLLELLISLSLLAVMLVMSYGVFATALQSVPRGEDLAERSSRLRAATSIMAKQVRSTVNYPARTQDDEFYPYFWGEPYSVSFITASPQLGGGAGLGWITFWSDGRSISMAERRIFSIEAISGGAPEASHQTLLLDGLSGTRFQYLRLEGDESEWRDTWDGLEEQTLPAAIRVTLDGLNLGQSYWVEEIPIMAVVYGLGAYDAEVAVPDQSDEVEDVEPPDGEDVP